MNKAREWLWYALVLVFIYLVIVVPVINISGQQVELKNRIVELENRLIACGDESISGDLSARINALFAEN